jgi:hypothetical protein
MANFLEERDYSEVFQTHGVYFLDAINSRNWGYLIHTEDFYIPYLVQEFYNSMASGHINYEHNIIKLNWRGDYRTIDLNLIQEVTGIPISTGDQESLPLVDYLPIMGPNCENPRTGGIKGTTTYKNVYAAGRWACTNVIGTSHSSSFYEPTLHIIHTLMSRNFRFYMCQQLFSTICQARRRLDTQPDANMLLPCLVTKLCKTFVSDYEYNEALNNNSSVIIREQLTRGYGLSE